MAVIKSGSSTDQAFVTPANAVKVDGSAVTQPVSISGTLQTDDVSSSNTGAAVPAEAIQIGLNKSGTLVAATADPNGNLNINIADVSGSAAVAKGVQPAAAIPTQDLKDSGRSKVVLTLTKATAIIAEALVTLTQKKGDAATTTGTSYTVTAGKILRIQSMFISITNVTTAAIDSVAVRLREGAISGGAVSVTSDIIAELEASNPAAVLNTSGQSWNIFPDGLEIVGGQQLGVSMVSPSVNGQVTVTIIGYEY